MDLKKSVGIWMDYASANIIDVQDNSNTPHIILSEFTNEVKHESMQRGEKGTHEKEDSFKKEYFNAIINVIKDFEHVLLFGPTNAKRELHNIVSDLPRYSDIKIDVFTTDDMTDNQKQAYVRKHFLLF
jgi:stalled ribosome rescue protein Dom34